MSVGHLGELPPPLIPEVAFALVLPAYVREGKSYLSIGVGCTGGRHRSVSMVEELRRSLEERGFPPAVVHRDIDRE